MKISFPGGRSLQVVRGRAKALRRLGVAEPRNALPCRLLTIAPDRLARSSLVLNKVMSMLTQIDVLEFLIHKGPGRTERELAEAIFGKGAQQPWVNQDCRMLDLLGRASRRGAGGISDPYRYYRPAI